MRERASQILIFRRDVSAGLCQNCSYTGRTTGRSVSERLDSFWANSYILWMPLKETADRPDHEDRCRQILQMMIAECCAGFEQLPCLLDVDILRNILYDGVWNRYKKVQQQKKEAKE